MSEKFRVPGPKVRRELAGDFPGDSKFFGGRTRKLTPQMGFPPVNNTQFATKTRFSQDFLQIQ
jgi:hypothetical protein